MIPKPLPASRAFAMAEVGVSYRILGSLPTSKIISRRETKDGIKQSEFYRPIDRSWYMTSDAGFMVNINRRYAVGATHFLGVINVEHVRNGVKMRLRRWLGETSSIDISAGGIFWTTEAVSTTPVFTGGIDVRLKEWLALTGIYEYTPPPRNINRYYDRNEYEEGSAFYLGLKSGSYPGLIANAGAVIFGFIYYLAISAGD
jgi:hypothetical protein